MSYFSDQATQFQKLADNINTRIASANPPLDKDTRSNLEDQRDGLVNQASAMIVDDIQTQLNRLQLDQARLSSCTLNLNNAVKTVAAIDHVVALAAAALTLATAIACANPGQIASALVGAEQAVAGAAGKSNVVAMPSPPTAPASNAGTVTTLAASADSGKVDQ